MNNSLFTFDVDVALHTIQETKTIAISRFSKISSPPSEISSEISKISEISNVPSVNLEVPINNILTPPPANSANLEKLIKCHDCEYFLLDKIGDGSGIGTCKHDIRFTQEARGRLPLYRYAKRHCTSFSNVSK